MSEVADIGERGAAYCRRRQLKRLSTGGSHARQAFGAGSLRPFFVLKSATLPKSPPRAGLTLRIGGWRSGSSELEEAVKFGFVTILLVR